MHTILTNTGQRIKVSDLQFDNLIIAARYDKLNSTVRVNDEYHIIPLSQFKN